MKRKSTAATSSPAHDREETQEPSYRERLKARLLEMAEAIIARDGLAALQVRRIASDAGCSVGTVYNIFGDFDGLILGANERTLADLDRTLRATARRSAAADLGTRLKTLATAYLDFATVNQLRWRAVFQHQVADTAILPPSYVEDRQRLLALLAEQLAGTISDAEDRSVAAHALFSAVHGIVLLSLDGKLGQLAAEHCERQIRFLVDHVVRGLSQG